MCSRPRNGCDNMFLYPLKRIIIWVIYYIVSKMRILVTDAHGIWPNVWGLNSHVFRGKRPTRNLPRKNMIYYCAGRSFRFPRTSTYCSWRRILFTVTNTRINSIHQWRKLEFFFYKFLIINKNNNNKISLKWINYYHAPFYCY